MSILIGWWKRYKIYYGSLLQTSWFLLEAQDRDTRRETEDGGDMRDAMERTLSTWQALWAPADSATWGLSPQASVVLTRRHSQRRKMYRDIRV
jgi:hypothetical protein